MRRIAVTAAALVAVLVVADTAVRFWGMGRMRSAFDAWKTAMAASGWTVTAGPARAGGWPFAVALELPDIRIAGGEADIPGGLRWGAQRVTASVGALHPMRLDIAPVGIQDVRIAGAPDLRFTADPLALTIPLGANAPSQRIDFTGRNLRVGTAPENAATAALFGGHVELWPSAVQGQPVFAVSVSAQAITLPPLAAGRDYALGARIASGVLEASVTGPIPPIPDPAARAAAWRDGGGTVRVEHFSLGWGPLGVSGDAKLTLDQQLQLAGSGNVHVVGQSETVDALTAAHAINASTATAARSLLGLLARVPQGGGAPELDLPVAIAHRTVAIGHFPLLRVPELVWPAAQ
jgi:hypothetical protein